MVLRTIAIASLIALTLCATGAATTRQADARPFRGGGFGPGAGFAAVAGLAAGVLTASAAYDFYSHPPGGATQRAFDADRVYAYGPLGY